MKYVKHKTLAAFFTRFFKPRMDRIILSEATDEDLKTVLWSMKKKLDKAIRLIDTAELINEGEMLGSPKIARVGELEQIREFDHQTELKAVGLLKDLGL